MDAPLNYVEELRVFALTKGVAFGANLLIALAILLIGRWLARVFARMLGRALERSKTDPALVKFLTNLIYALLLAFIIVFTLERLGVNTTSFAAVVAAAGLAIGLALQSSLSNFAAGVLLIMNRHFSLGDRIEAGGNVGRVEDIQIFSTVLRADDGVKIIMPNSAVLSGTLKVFPSSSAAAPTKAA
jgi:small conductance mechanosensitive channel